MVRQRITGATREPADQHQADRGQQRATRSTPRPEAPSSARQVAASPTTTSSTSTGTKASSSAGAGASRPARRRRAARPGRPSTVPFGGSARPAGAARPHRTRRCTTSPAETECSAARSSSTSEPCRRCRRPRRADAATRPLASSTRTWRPSVTQCRRYSARRRRLRVAAARRHCSSRAASSRSSVIGTRVRSSGPAWSSGWSAEATRAGLRRRAARPRSARSRSPRPAPTPAATSASIAGRPCASPISRSFGHFRDASTPTLRRTASSTASPASSGQPAATATAARRSGGTARSGEPGPAGDVQPRPRRPRPAAWCSATQHGPVVRARGSPRRAGRRSWNRSRRPRRRRPRPTRAARRAAASKRHGWKVTKRPAASALCRSGVDGGADRRDQALQRSTALERQLGLRRDLGYYRSAVSRQPG